MSDKNDEARILTEYALKKVSFEDAISCRPLVDE